VVEIRELQPIAPDDLAVVRRLSAAAAAADGHPSLGEAIWRKLQPGADPRSLGVLALESRPGSGSDPIGFGAVVPNDNGSIPRWSAGLVIDPAHRFATAQRALLEHVVAHVAGSGGGRLTFWAFDPSHQLDTTARDVGFVPARELHQLRTPLPLDEEPVWPDGVSLRPFRPGHDEPAWVEVNNRAFAGHPEQGDWTVELLRAREQEPWFDPDGFLLAIDADGLAGSCWTKIHPIAPPEEPEALGEIFVISVDPSRQGSGLGRALALAGLASLNERGVTTGMLFVDKTNKAAMRLYRDLGFVTTRIDRAYESDVAAA
jgi:mycothiol synthase